MTEFMIDIDGVTYRAKEIERDWPTVIYQVVEPIELDKVEFTAFIADTRAAQEDILEMAIRNNYRKWHKHAAFVHQAISWHTEARAACEAEQRAGIEASIRNKQRDEHDTEEDKDPTDWAKLTIFSVCAGLVAAVGLELGCYAIKVIASTIAK